MKKILTEDDLIKSAKRIQGYDELDFISLNTYENQSTKREIGDVWKDDKYTYTQKDGFVTKTKNSHNVMDMYTCGCGRVIKSSNEMQVFFSTSKCLKCNAKEETEKILNKEEFVPPSWYEDIIFTDSYGNPTITLKQFIKEVGEEKSIPVLENLKNSIIKMKEDGKKVNNHKLNKIIKILEEFKTKYEKKGNSSSV